MDTVIPAYCGGCAYRLAESDKAAAKIHRHDPFGCFYCPNCNGVFAQGEGCPLHTKVPYVAPQPSALAQTS